MFLEHERSLDDLAPEALHAEMKCRVVVLNSREKISYDDGVIKNDRDSAFMC